MSERETILAGLQPLFEEARREGKWFWCAYQDLWFTPDDLAAEHAKGSFIWGAANWRLRDPREKLAQEEAEAKAAAERAARTRAQLTQEAGHA